MTQTRSSRAWREALVVMTAILFQGLPLPPAAVFAKIKTPANNPSRAAQQKVSSTSARPQRTPLQSPLQVNIVATKRDAFPDHGDGMVHEGDTITYTVVVTNNGDTDAVGVTFNDVVDGTTSTLVPGSAQISPIAVADLYAAIGNVRLNTDGIAGAGHSVTDNDTLTNGGVLSGFGPTQATANSTAPNGTNTVTTVNGGTVLMDPDGTFTFNPAPGFTGSDSFFYAVTSPTTGTGTAKVTIDVSATIWFVNASAPSGGDGRLTSPFNCLVGAGCFDPVAADDPGDIIFLYTGAYTGGLTLLNNQKLVGQGASTSLQSIAGITVPPGSDSLPSTGGVPPVVSTAQPSTNGVNLAVGASNTLRGFSIINTTGAKIASGATFGILTLGDNSAADLFLAGTGQALSLTNGTFGATSGLSGVVSTLSAGQGVALSGVGGTIAFGGTTIGGNTTQCILVSGSTANIDFGNTSCTGGTDGVSLQNNSSGIRTFGLLSVGGGSGNAFLHAVGGGNTTIAGAASFASSGNPIEIQNSGAATINFAGGATATKTTAGGAGVDLVNASVTFESLGIVTSNGPGLSASSGSTVTVTNGSKSIAATGTGAQPAPAILANGITLNTNFLSVSSTNSGGGGNGISLTNVSGTSNFGTGSITGATGAAFSVNGGNPAVTYSGNITQNNAQRVVDVQNTTSGSIVFNTGTITGGASSTGVNINAANGNVSFANLNLGTVISRTTNQAITITGGTGTYSLGTISIFTNNVAGIVANNADGTINSASGTVNATAAVAGTNAPAINIDGPAGLTTLGMTLTSVSANNSTNGILIQDTNGSFTVTGVGSTDGTGGTISNITNRGASFINATSISLSNMTFTNVGTVNGADPTNSASTCGDLTVGGNTGCNAGIHLQTITVGSNPTVGASLTNVDLNGGVQVGINGNNVTNFVLANSNVLNFGNQVREDGVKFLNMLGTSSITGTTFDNNEAVQIHIENSSGTLTGLTVQNVTLQNSAAPNGSHGIQFTNHGSANSKLVVQNSAFQNLFSNCIQADTDSTGTMDFIETSSTFNQCGASGITISQDGSGAYKFNIHDNGSLLTPTFLGGTSSHAINVNQAGNAPASALMQGAITNNFIGNATSSTSATAGGDAIRALSIAPGTLTVLIQGNTTQGSGANGINVQMSEDTAVTHTLNATILNNNATVTDINSFDGIRVVAGALSGDAGTLCAEIANNNGSAAAGSDFTVRQRFATTFQLRGYTGGNTNTAAVQTYLDTTEANNATHNVWFITTQAPGGGFVNTPGGAQCTQPVLPTTPIRLSPESEKTASVPVTENAVPAPGGSVSAESRDINPKAPQPEGSGKSITSWSAVILESMAQRWAALSDLSSLVSVPVTQALNVSGDGSVLVPANRIRPVRMNHAARNSSRPQPATALSGGTVNLDLGTISAGSSVTITFQVTVNTGIPSNINNVSNQGTISGGNFASVLTDDPDTAQPIDPTLTPLLHPTASDGIVSGRILAEDGSPVEGVVLTLNGTQSRKTISDRDGNYQFDKVETGGFYTVTPSRANFNFNPFNRSFNQLTNRTEASFTGLFLADNANPVDTPEYFVRQQYVDILGREPDEGGFNYWSDRILECGTDLQCANTRRRDVAAAFFIEQEFQQTGSFVYNIYKGTLGRVPLFAEYAADRKQVVAGTTLDADKLAFAQAFVQRAEFVQRYQANGSADSFVDALISNVQQTSGVDLSSKRDVLISRYNAGSTQIESRGFVVRELADDSLLRQAEYNSAFVLTEYFGYLRRDPDAAGYAFWLDVLNSHEVGNYRGMVCAFVTSTEYQRRFSAVISRSNRDCGQ